MSIYFITLDAAQLTGIQHKKQVEPACLTCLYYLFVLYFYRLEIHVNTKLFLPLLITASSTLHATDRLWTLSYDAFYCKPIGSLNSMYTSDAAFGVNFYVEWYFASQHCLNIGLTMATEFPRKEKIINGSLYNSKLRSSCESLNYKYHFKEGSLGPYLLAGIGAKRFEAIADSPISTTTQDIPGDPLLTNIHLVADTGLKLAWLVGGGYGLTKDVGINVRFVGMQAMGHTLATFEGGLYCRF